MLKIYTETNNNELTIKLEGRLDTMSAPDLEEVLQSSIEGIESLVFDLIGLEYISSAGLRILLYTQKRMHGMKVIGVQESVLEIFEVTGFTEFLSIEK